MDELDHRIVALLQANARRSFQDIGQHVGLTAPAVKRRVDRLQAEGVIQGYAAIVNPALTGLDYFERTAVALPGLALLACGGPAPVADRVRALRGGADDWITKPCHPEELVARIQAVLRRRRAGEVPAEDSILLAGELAIRPDRFDAYVGSEPATLSRKEYELLYQLAVADGRVLEVGAAHERCREDAVHRRAEASAADRQKEETDALVPELDGSRRSRVHVEWNTWPAPCRTKTDERDLVMQLREGPGQGARLRLGASDRRKELLRDNDAHRVANLGERLADVSVSVSERSGVRLLDAVDHAVPIPLLAELR